MSPMRPARVRTWSDVIWEMFERGGLFSLRRPGTAEAERQLQAERRSADQPGEITRLNIQPDAPPRPRA
jgi:hypothetical protein